MNISLYQAASALSANARWQEVIAENMSAASIPGYKRQEVTFKAVEAGMMPAAVGDTTAANMAGMPWATTEAETTTSFAQGEMRYTGLATDVGIDGAGFFEVQMPNGALAYTRDGEFQIDGEGRMVTKQGHIVMSDSGPIQLDRNSGESIAISPTGEVSQGQTVRGTLKVVAFSKPELLTPISGGMYLAQNPSLEVATEANPSIRQFYLEQANTTPVIEMANMISVMRASEANQRIIQMEDERMGRAIQELGTPV